MDSFHLVLYLVLSTNIPYNACPENLCQISQILFVLTKATFFFHKTWHSFPELFSSSSFLNKQHSLISYVFLSCIDGSPETHYYFGLSDSLAFFSVIHPNSNLLLLSYFILTCFSTIHYQERLEMSILTLVRGIAKYCCSPCQDCSIGM